MTHHGLARRSARSTHGFIELIVPLEETAIAGMATLQILGGRLARNEVWGGPFDEDNAEAE